ncbi:hypothetical protein NBRC3257_1491 [Gluconobacter thailandicus NBRC 3257]|uniref:Uncharacterized protein n=1 Tax=Gluconobacter thailandicus NBRC 3257 TaxID=1381097 RepID=A0ABQ0IWA2_GLUTH|nr:hypothetical protein NBRC3255_2848 [Gluconobacter thailandicus NBRC 3255]GAD26492.1 hypothetical protein NBRC3257_1491 [Gluconobacter thailandicus NBRC 3257]
MTTTYDRCVHTFTSTIHIAVGFIFISKIEAYALEYRINS